MAISSFPRFDKLNLSHKAEIEAFTARFVPYSDYNFISMFCWNVSDKTEISILNGNLIVRFSDYLTSEIAYGIFGKNEIDKSLDEVFKITKLLSFVPRVVVSNIDTKRKYRIVYDRASSDYVYELMSLATLTGEKNKKKRNKANRFRASFDDLRVVNTRSFSVDSSNRLRAVIKKWAKENNKSEEEFINEDRAILRFLNFADKFNVLSTEIYVNGELVGFSFNEILKNKMAICHFEKALTVHEDIYPFLAQESAKALLAEGCTTINWEQDLGLEGLRKSKMSYHPVRMLKKYTIEKVEN